VINFYLITKATDRAWREPGLSEEWRLWATLVGAGIGIAIGLVFDVALCCPIACKTQAALTTASPDHHAGQTQPASGAFAPR